MEEDAPTTDADEQDALEVWLILELCDHSPEDHGETPVGHVLAKLTRSGGRLSLARLIIDSERIDSRVFRRLSVSRIEATANAFARRDGGELLVEGFKYMLPTRRASELDNPIYPNTPLHAGLRAIDEAVTALVGEVEVLESGGWRPKDQPPSSSTRPLRRPDGADPMHFSWQVAEAYEEVARETHRPAAVLAQEAGVPVTTVHRWIREARQRGFLPPARKGRAG